MTAEGRGTEQSRFEVGVGRPGLASPECLGGFEADLGRLRHGHVVLARC